MCAMAKMNPRSSSDSREEEKYGSLEISYEPYLPYDERQACRNSACVVLRSTGPEQWSCLP